MNITSGTVAAMAFAILPALSEPLQKAEKEVRERTGADVRWQKEHSVRKQGASIVARLLDKPLNVSSAVQIALLNNRGLQATFEEIGIARADVIEAVTIPNPSLDFEVTFPNVAPFGQKYAWLLAQDFVQLLMIPLKKRVAEEELEAAEFRVAAECLKLVEEVKAAYFTIQASEQLLSRLRIVQETASAALDLAQKQFEAGNITDLTLLQFQASYSEGRIEIARTETDLRSHREKFNRLLGLWGTQTDWKIRGDLPPVPDSIPSISGLESLAVSQRLDLRGAHRALTSVVSALGLTKTYRWIPVLEFGFTGERDLDGQILTGPAFRFEIPIFNQGQSRIARGLAELRRAEARLEALAIDIRSEVREMYDKLVGLRDMAKFYHDDVLPTHIRIVNRALLQYNAMQLSPYELFLAKKAELDAERSYIETLRDYWITHAALERTVGGTLTPRRKSDLPPKTLASNPRKQEKKK